MFANLGNDDDDDVPGNDDDDEVAGNEVENVEMMLKSQHPWYLSFFYTGKIFGE